MRLTGFNVTVGNRPNTVSGSTVSNTELSEFFGLTEFRGASSVSSFQPFICVPKRTHRVFRRTHRVCPKTQPTRAPVQAPSGCGWPLDCAQSFKLGTPKEGVASRGSFIEFFRGRPREGDNFTSLFQVLQTLYSKRQKHPFSLLRVATPSGAPRQAPLEFCNPEAMKR